MMFGHSHHLAVVARPPLHTCVFATVLKHRRQKKCLILLDDVWVFEEITILFVIYSLFQFSSFGGC